MASDETLTMIRVRLSKYMPTEEAARTMMLIRTYVLEVTSETFAEVRKSLGVPAPPTIK